MTGTLLGSTVDVDVFVAVTVKVDTGVAAVTVEVGLTAMIFSVYMIAMYLVPENMGLEMKLWLYGCIERKQKRTCNRCRIRRTKRISLGKRSARERIV